MRPLKIDGTIRQPSRPTGLHANIDNGGRAERSVFRYFLALPIYFFSSGDSKSLCDNDAQQSLIGESSEIACFASYRLASKLPAMLNAPMLFVRQITHAGE
jgi:hypothetical protein